MPVTATPRLGITDWSAGADPLTRAQIDGSFAILDNLTAIDLQGTLAARPAAAIRGRYYYATDNGFLYRDTGAAWVSLGAAFGVAAGTIALGDTATEGVSSSAARADHRHAFPAPAAGYPKDARGVRVDGTSAIPARSDHRHRLKYASYAKRFAI